jgi:hypothetical protein
MATKLRRIRLIYVLLIKPQVKPRSSKQELCYSSLVANYWKFILLRIRFYNTKTLLFTMVIMRAK